MPSDEAVDAIADERRDDHKNIGEAPESSELSQAGEDRSRLGDDFALVPQHDSVQVLTQRWCEELSRGGALDGGKLNASLLIPWQKPVHQTVAETANAIEE